MVNRSHEPREQRPPLHHTRFLFPLGQIVATPGALQVMEEHGINASELIRRHASGDWGDLCESDCAENERALRDGSRLFSAYSDAERGTRLWVITEAGDRSVTTILRPEDY
jgi:hypothetical protein